MAKLVIKHKENPKLLQSKLADGRISLYLEYYLGRSQTPVLKKNGEQEYYEDGKMKGQPKIHIKHIRKKYSLDLYLIRNPRTPLDRQKNNDTIEIAQKIRAQKEQDFKQNKIGYQLEKPKNINFLVFFQSYIDEYTKKDKKMVKMALTRFKDFLKAEYPFYQNGIKPEQLNKDMMVAFVDYLQSHSVGEGARSVFQRFKKVIHYAVEHEIMLRDPCAGVACKIDDQTLKKDVLSTSEIKMLLSTKYEGQNPEIRRAFIFSLYTGIRYCDIIELTYGCVDYSNKILKFEQNKTKGHRASSGVIIPLNDGLLSIIGTPPDNKTGDVDREALIFHLPSHTMCSKALKHWMKRAGIPKHITWHCARHSFAVNILNNGANIKTVASLLGHSGLKHTEKYTRAVDELKAQAINSLPEIVLK